SLLKISEFPSTREDQVVVMRVGEAEFGIVLERIGDLMEVVLEKLPRMIRQLSLYRGAALIQGEKLAMVMDAAGLARAIGFRQVRDVPPVILPRQADASLKGFLIFRAGQGVPKALPLDQVVRVDEMTIDTPGVRITTLPGAEFPSHGSFEAIVLA